MKYVGLCCPAAGWGPGDMLGRLIVETELGWSQAAVHISSSSRFSRLDIERHYAKRDNPSADDTYEWVGEIKHEDAIERFPPGTAT